MAFTPVATSYNLGSSSDTQGHHSPDQPSPIYEQGDSNTKRRRTEGDTTLRKPTTSSRKTACISCRTRKVKCDNERPACGFCRSGDRECVYIENPADKLLLDPATKLMVGRLDQILAGVENIGYLMLNNETTTVNHPPPCMSPSPVTNHRRGKGIEPAKDYLEIPACRGSADDVLLWPIFDNSYGAECLIGAYLQPCTTRSSDGDASYDQTVSNNPATTFSADTWAVHGGLRSIPEERIPALIDKFLQNVHTKNPILDGETLVQLGRLAAERGLGWDAQSCLVLLACALGSISHPFTESLRFTTDATSVSLAPTTSAPSKDTSASVFASELQQGESCFVLALRRIGLLRHTILGSQCHFFAGGRSSPSPFYQS